MVFSSITFLFFFLPAILFFYHLSGKWKNLWLLLTSLLFYAWGEGAYLLIMIVSITGNYLLGRILRENRDKSLVSKGWLFLALFYNFSILGFFKYANFLVENLNPLLSTIGFPVIQHGPVHLPIGISFFTFQAVSYLVDVYRGVVEPQKNIINLGLYISLFPQLIAGPIVRYHDIAASLIKRSVSSSDFAYGIRRFLFGLSKKVLLANPLGLVADKIFILPQNELSVPVAWLGAVCYTLQIYYDFSGYSDMAIGLGRMFGFRFLENFNYPYVSRSIREFWRRWHISLSSWFRDYLYIPIGGNQCGNVRTYLNLIIVFVLCGMWHGASWAFVCWGLYHGFFLVVERISVGRLLDRLWPPVRYLLTIVIIISGWVIFRCDTLSEAIVYLQVMYGLLDGAERQLHFLYLDNKLICELMAAMILAYPLLPLVKRLRGGIEKRINGSVAQPVFTMCAELINLAALVGITYFTVISLAAGVYNPFIYFRF